MNVCESKASGYRAIIAYFLGIAIIYPLTMFASSDLDNDELGQDRYFGDS